MRRLRLAAAVVAPLLWSNVVRPALPLDQRGRTAVNAAFATGYAVVLGGAPRWCAPRGLRYGAFAAAGVTAGYALAVAVPALRAGLAVFAARDADTDPLEWVTVHIPLGTVYSEELIFRATLDPLLDQALGSRLGPVAAAGVFGLWHIAPARAAGDNVPLTVLTTGAGGLLFGLLARRAGSATAPALLHLALNAGGVLAPRLARALLAPDTPADRSYQL